MKVPFVFVLLALPIALPALAHDNHDEESQHGSDLWDSRFYLWAGYMWTNHDTKLRVDARDVVLGSDVGTTIDFEDTLGLEDTVDQVLRLGFRWRFHDRHSLGVETYSFNRDARVTTQNDLSFEDLDVMAGATVDSELNIDIYEIEYAYSFLRSARHDLRGLFGLHWMVLDATLTGSGAGNVFIDGKPVLSDGASASESASLHAPLPVIGLQYNFQFVRNWVFSSRFKYFAIRSGVMSGNLTNVDISVGYQTPWKLYVSGGLSVFDLGIEVEDDDQRLRVDWGFWGPQIRFGARF